MSAVRWAYQAEMAKAVGNTICLDEKSLKRRKEIVLGLVKSLVPDPKDIFVISGLKGNGRFVWAVKHRLLNNSNDFETWRFKTKFTSIYASYIEEWKKYYEGHNELWFMDRAYLHFYRYDAESSQNRDYLFLHSDPNETRDHAIYKQLPHLHIEVAPAPWPRAHLAFGIEYREATLVDDNSLTRSFRSAIAMLESQVLSQLAD